MSPDGTPGSRFDVPAESYDRFMGRYSAQLAPLFADFAGVKDGMRVVDVGCGPGALTVELARRVGPGNVSAADPAPHFAAACAERVPGANVRTAQAEELPFDDGAHDAALAQLVMGFVRDPQRAVGEMRRVTKPGGTLAACMWADGKMDLFATFWGAAAETVRSDAPELDRAARYRTRDEWEALIRDTGLEGAELDLLTVEAGYDDFDDFWGSILGSAGPVGAFFETLDEGQVEAVREAARRRLGDPSGPFTMSGSAWALRAPVA